MQYLVGLILGLVVAVFAAWVGLDRDRALYPAVLVVVASYYALFAVMGASARTILVETLLGSVFVLFAVLGFKKNLWFAAVGIAGHGVFDLLHHLLIDDPGVPPWWPGFCMTIDVVLGAWVGLRLMKPFRAFPTARAPR
jgi:hypothetical protein